LDRKQYYGKLNIRKVF